MKVKSPSINVMAALYAMCAKLTKSERVILAALAAGQFTETENFSKAPIVSLAEKGYVVIGKNAKLTGKGRKLANICLEEATNQTRKSAKPERVYDDPRDPMFNTYDD